MKLLNKFCLLATAMLVCATSLVLPVAASSISTPYELHLASEGTTGVQVSLEPVNNSVKAFQISLELGDTVKPDTVTWNPAITSSDLKECVYDEATNTLNLYVVSDKNLVQGSRLQLGTINFLPKDATATTVQYAVDLKKISDNIVFVDNTNRTVRYNVAPEIQGERVFTYQKSIPPYSGGGGGGGGSIVLLGGKDKDKAPVTDSAKPAEQPPAQNVPTNPPAAITSPVTTGGGSTALPPPSIQTDPEGAAPPTTPSDATEGTPSTPGDTPPMDTPDVVPKKSSFFPIAATIGAVAAGAGILAFLKAKHIF